MAEEHFNLAIIGGGVLEDGAAGRAGSEGAGAFSLGVTGFGRAMTPVEDVLDSPGLPCGSLSCDEPLCSANRARSQSLMSFPGYESGWRGAETHLRSRN